MKPDKIGKYKITGELGKGSMGMVFEATGPDGGKPVAVKVFYPDPQLTAAESQPLLDRFEREGSALQQVSHTNVVSVLDVGTDGNLEYIVMEKLEGMNLRELLALGTRFTLRETFDLMHQLLSGLSACHRQGIIHRDVKPANVVRNNDGAIKLTDFGIARIITDQTLSRTGTVVGTPNYMSPEQIRGEEVDPRSDIFSAGVMMYELLTAHKPFDGPDVTAIMYNVVNVHPPSPRFYNGALPVEFEEIAFKAIAKDAKGRYATADEFSRALKDLEQELHYQEGTESVLSALPAAPDADAAIGGAFDLSSALSSPTVAPPAPPSAQSSAISGVSLSGAGGIAPGKIYCIDCGMQNEESSDFCVRCMRPIVRRDMITQLAAQQAKFMHRVKRGDYLFLTCLSIVIAATVILILYVFFRGAWPQ